LPLTASASVARAVVPLQPRNLAAGFPTKPNVERELAWADARPSFYSHKAAPGIVMATGNTGDYLDFAADITCTWLSHDGGATWQDVLNFPGIYEFGDHGGIILMAPHQVHSGC